MKPNRLDSLRNRISKPTASTNAPLRRRSRRDTEVQHQRTFMISMLAVAAIVVLILGGGALYEYQIKPNQVLAKVNGHEITRKDYWQYQSISLYNMSSAYQSYAMQSSGNPQQQQQFLQLANSFEQQRQDIWGSTSVSSATLQQMIEDQLYLDGAESLGIVVTDDQVRQFSLNQFAPSSSLLLTPVPSPTLIPARADMATQAANDLATQQSIAMGTIPPTTAATPGSNGTPGAVPVVGATPVAGTPVPSTPLPATPVVATPIAGSPVVGTPVAGSPVAGTPGVAATPTLSPEDAQKSADAEFGLYREAVFSDAHLSESRYLTLWAKPNYVRQLVDQQLTNNAPQVAEMVNAEHILVGTEELANQLYQQATGGANFEELAKTNSTDTATASTGGKLGWFMRSEVDPAMADAAFGLDKNGISAPFQTAFGWEIVRVVDKQAEHPMTDAQYQKSTKDVVDKWLADQRANASISNDKQTTPTPTAAAFQPPAGAPTAVVPTTVPPTATPATPIIGPLPVTPGASVPATPGATPVASPAATPGATPVSSPVSATPAATP